MKIALIQFDAGPDKNKNLRRALSFVSDATKKKARFVLFPEMFLYRGNLLERKNLLYAAETIPGESLRILSQEAVKQRVFILAGSIPERIGLKAYNTSVLINPQGKVIARYRKIHLFGAKLRGQSINESRCFLKGNAPVIGEVEGFRIGMSICYDLRFPDLYQQYRSRGVHIMTAPSCFTRITGLAHWEVLLRARAIETQSFVLAPNQIGTDGRGVVAYGNSMIINPWGEILARGSDDKEEILIADIDPKKFKIFQKVLPGFRKSV